MGYVYKDMERLRFWCQKVLPTVYDDSLSYYELLTKVVQYLNDTVENVNTLIQQVADIDADLSRVALIDDNVISADYTWSSQKSNHMMNEKLHNAIINTRSTGSTGATYSCKYLTDNFAELQNGKIQSSELPDGVVNSIDSVSLNGVEITPDANKNVNVTAVPMSSVGAVNGVAGLDASGKVPSSQLPSYVDDVIDGYYDSITNRFYEDADFQHMYTPMGGKCWVDLATNKSYRWTGSGYVRVDEGVQLGETSDTAYAGNKGKANADAIAGIEAKIPSGASSSNQLVDSLTYSNGLSSRAPIFDVDEWTINWLQGAGIPDKLYVMEHDEIPQEGTHTSGLPNDEAVRKAIISAYDLIKDTVGWRGKNKVDFAQFVRSVNTVTENNGVYTAVATSQTDNYPNVSWYEKSDGFILYPAGKYRITMNIVSFTNDTARLSIRDINNGIKASVPLSVGKITLNVNTDYDFYISLLLRNGNTNEATVVFSEVMMCDAYILDTTFEPHHESVENAIKLNKSEVTNISTNATLDTEVGNELYKQGNIVSLNIALTGVTESAYTTLFRIPEGYRPKKYVKARINNKVFQISSGGNCICQSALTNEIVELNLTWITS